MKVRPAQAAPAKPAAGSASDDSDEDDEDLDLFGELTPEEQKAADEKKRIIEAAKKRGAEKAKLTKSMVVLEVKPWDDTTGMVLRSLATGPLNEHQKPLKPFILHSNVDTTHMSNE